MIAPQENGRKNTGGDTLKQKISCRLGSEKVEAPSESENDSDKVGEFSFHFTFSKNPAY